MRHRPNGAFKWIGQYIDHWAKFHVLFPLVRKSAAEVAVALLTKCLHYTCICYARLQYIDAKGDHTLGNMLHATQMITSKSSVNHQ